LPPAGIGDPGTDAGGVRDGTEATSASGIALAGGCCCCNAELLLVAALLLAGALPNALMKEASAEGIAGRAPGAVSACERSVAAGASGNRPGEQETSSMGRVT
jgi:hypothetical protein